MSFSLPYKYITAEELAGLIKATPGAALKEFAVIDVRGDDFVAVFSMSGRVLTVEGGNIVDCINSPAESIHEDLPGLVKRLEKVPKVIFHCALSQQRGPKSARIYAEFRAALLPDAQVQQEVLVLREGFSGFQAKYRNDPVLVEKFNKRYHD